MIHIDITEGWTAEGTGSGPEIVPGVWSNDENTTYPYLTPIAKGKAVTVGKTKIYTLSQLDAIRNDLEGDYVLMNDIDATETATWNDGAGWEPIGGETLHIPYQGFRGTFDGNGYTISGLYIRREGDNLGFFSTIDPPGVVKNLNILDAHIECIPVDEWWPVYHGILAGSANAPQVSYCNVSGTVISGPRSYDSGGLFGDIHVTVASVEMPDPFVFRCSANANVSAEGNGGAFVGGIYDPELVIQECYAQGSVSVDDYGGGFAYKTNCAVYGCYSAVAIDCNGSTVGGFTAVDYGMALSTYYDQELAGGLSSYLATGKTTAEMMDRDTYVNWDFGTVSDSGDITYSDGVNVVFGDMETGEVASILKTGNWNIAGSAYISTKVTSRYPPSKFGTFKIYLKDFAGKTASYKLGNKDMGLPVRASLPTLSYESGFNRSSISEIGVTVSSPKTSLTNMGLTVEHITIGDVIPTYTTAQRVVNQIGIIDNKTGDMLVPSANTRPPLATVERWIIEAESYLDGRCRMSWKESVAKNIIIDRPEYWKTKRPGGRNPYMIGGIEGGMAGKGHPFKLPHRNIREIDPDKGDKIEMRGIGQEFTDITDDTEAYWLDYNEGRIYIRKWFVSSPKASLRLTYRYGHDDIPEDIQRATTLKAGLSYLQTDWFRGKVPEGPDFSPNKSETIREWNEEIERIIASRQSVSFIGGV